MFFKAISRIIIFFFVLLQGMAYAQNLTKSPYSSIGVGEMMFQGTARQSAMGETGQAICDTFEVNNLNPASYAGLKFTVFEGAYAIRQGAISSQLNSNMVQTFSFTYFMLGIPISVKRGIGVSAGIMPYSGLGYNLSLFSSENAFNYYTDLNGRGGLTRGYGGVGIRLFKGFSAGFNASYIFGQLRQLSTLRAIDANYYNINDQEFTTVRDVQMQGGIQYSVKLSPDYILRLGATATLPASFSAKQDFVVRTSQGNGTYTIDTVDKQLGSPATIEMPAMYRGGLVLQHTNKKMKHLWELSIDGSQEYWSDFRFNNGTDSLKNCTGINAGIAYIPDAGNTKSYFSRIEYRLGVRYNNGNINLSGNDITTSAASVGFGLPMGKSKSRMNLTIEYMTRGTTKDRLLLEEYFRFTLGVTMADRWFMRRQYD